MRIWNWLGLVGFSIATGYTIVQCWNFRGDVSFYLWLAALLVFSDRIRLYLTTIIEGVEQ
jgi:hypothetical protein